MFIPSSETLSFHEKGLVFSSFYRLGLYLNFYQISVSDTKRWHGVPRRIGTESFLYNVLSSRIDIEDINGVWSPPSLVISINTVCYQSYHNEQFESLSYGGRQNIFLPFIERWKHVLRVSPTRVYQRDERSSSVF